MKWPHISAACHCGSRTDQLPGRPQSGDTHFFQNLTSFGVGYFTINAFMNDGIQPEFLNAQPAVFETEYLVIHLRGRLL